MTGVFGIDYQRTYPQVTGKGAQLGVNIHTGAPSWYFTNAKNAGLGTVRINATWSSIEATQGTYDWSSLDPQVQNAAQAGFTTILFIAAGWVSWASATGSAPDSNTQTHYANFCAALANRYVAGGAYWTANPSITDTFTTVAIEVWNEPWFDSGTRVNSGAKYAPFASAAAAAIKGAQSSVKVVLPAQVFDVGTNATTWIAACNTAASGLLANVDVLSLHPYTLNGDFWGPVSWRPTLDPLGTQGNPTGLDFIYSSKIVVTAHEAYKLGYSLPVWVTEYGDTTVTSTVGGTAPLPMRDNCNAVATTNITLSGTQTVDGIALVAGNICLVTGQTTASQNGFYTVNSGAWTRVGWMQTGVQVQGAAGICSQGTSNKGWWIQSANGLCDTVAQTWANTAAGVVTEHVAAIRMRQALGMAFSRLATMPWGGPGIQRWITYDYSISSGTASDFQGNFGMLRAGSTSGSPNYKPAWAELLKFV